MNERIRVSLSVTLWCIVALAVLALAVYVLQREMNRVEDESAKVRVGSIERGAAESVGMCGERLAAIDNIVRFCIEQRAITGAVVGVVHQDKLVYAEAFGSYIHEGEELPMTLDRRFAMSGIVEAVAVAPAVMQLVECGIISFEDELAMYLPALDRGLAGESGKEWQGQNVRILDLLAHTSDSTNDFEPRTNSCYSPLNYMLLSDVVSRVSGADFGSYVKEHIFEPLSMTNTDCVKVEPCGSGQGLALNSTVEDLAIYAAMLLNGGEWQGKEILSARGVDAMLTAPRGFEEWERALGWMLCRGYSTAAGDLLTSAAVACADTSGASIVIDREMDLAIILLAEEGCDCNLFDMTALRSRIATIVASSMPKKR